MTHRRVLVTGGSGFVGSNLVRLLVEKGHEVHLLLRSGFRDWRIRALLADLRIHEWEPGDASGLRGIVERVRADWVFHLAAYGAYPTQRDEGAAFRTNVELTTQLVQACADVGFEVFVNAGSSSEYGFKDHAPTEDEPAQPVGPYATTKLASTQACRSAATRARAVDPDASPVLRLRTLRGAQPSHAGPRL